MIEYVIKRDERKEPFDADKLNNWAQWGEKTVNPKDFNWSGIVLRTVSLLGKECTTKELQDTLIKECLNQNTWESNRMAGRLYASALSKELYEIRKHPHIKELHDKLINLGIVIKPNYTNEEYEYINKLLNHKRDFTYSHYAINQLVQKYSLRDRIKKVSYETPQFIYMRVAMDTLNFYTKEDRLEKLKDLYEELSFQRVVVPTPYFANSLTRNPNKISCSVITCTDEAESIGVLNTLAYTLTTSGAGVGAHMKTRSINDPVRGGLVKHAGKVPYYRAFANIMKSSTQGCYDPETEVLTKSGWKFFKDVTEDDLIVQVHNDLSVEAVKPTRIIAYKHTGTMYQFGMDKSNGAFNVLVTPDHRMLYKQTKKVISDTAIQKHLDLGWSRITNTQWVSPEFSEVTAEKAQFSRLTCLFNSANTTVTSEVFSALDALRVAYQADGLTKQRGNCILFHISKTRKQLRLENLIQELGFTYEKITYNGGISYEYRIDKGEIDFNKNFDWVLPLTRSSNWLKTFLEELEHWDGTHLDTEQNSFAYFSTNEKCIDVAQMAASLCGAYSRKENIGRKKEHHQDRFRLTISFFKSYICSSKVTKAEVKDYDDMVYCVEVPSNKIIVRRRGLTLICGNSRSGAATMYFPIFDPEIEVLVGLKNPLSVLANRVRDSDYGVSINKPFLKRAFTGKPFWLFSYKDNPELYEKFYHWDSETFDKELEQFAKDNPDKVTEVDAKQLLSTALTHRAETGRLYPHFADITNSHTPYKETIYSSNLCAEISNVTKPYKTHLELYSDKPEGVVGFCNLAGINLGVIKDDEEYERACYYALFMIEQAIETATLPFPALNKNLKDYRSAGVGICSLAYLMAKNNKSYTTQEGRDFIFEQAERHQYFLTKAAIKLTEELGPCEAMSRNKYKDGWLPSDSAPKAVFDLVTVGFKYDWESLRERMKELGGLRFTTLSCLMPAESSSIAVSGTNSIFPLRDLTLVKTSGDTSNIWVAPEASRLAKKYEIVWDIPSEHIINLYALWQVFIDQAISADIFIDRTKNVNLSMSSMFKDLAQAAKLGVKTFYYLNTLTDKKDTFEFLNGIESEEEPSQNNEDVGCSSGGCTL